MLGASHVSFKNCRAVDFTRCGFVSDTYGDLPGTFSARVSFENCWAENGHDASIFYGGLEYNAGFWAEKSGGVSFLNCHAKDCYHRGFIMASGETINDMPWAEFSADNCTVDGSEAGFIVQGLSGVPAVARISNCSVISAGNAAYSFRNGTTKDFIRLTNCSASLSGTSISRSSVKASPGTLIIEGFTETWTVVNNTYRDAADNYYASLGHFADTVGKVVVRDWRTYDSSGALIPSVFKFLPATASTLNLHIERCYLRGVYINGLSLKTIDVDWERLGSIEVQDVYIIRGSNTEVSTPFSSPIFSTTKAFVFDGVRFDFSSSAGEMQFNNIDSVDPYAKLIFRGCTFIKNFETGDRAVKLSMLGGPSGTIAGTTNANHIVASDCIFVNTGGSTTNPAFYIDSNTDAAGKLHGRGNLKTSTLSNAVNGSKLATAASFENMG